MMHLFFFFGRMVPGRREMRWLLWKMCSVLWHWPGDSRVLQLKVVPCPSLSFSLALSLLPSGSLSFLEQSNDQQMQVGHMPPDRKLPQCFSALCLLLTCPRTPGCPPPSTLHVQSPGILHQVPLQCLLETLLPGLHLQRSCCVEWRWITQESVFLMQEIQCRRFRSALATAEGITRVILITVVDPHCVSGTMLGRHYFPCILTAKPQSGAVTLILQTDAEIHSSLLLRFNTDLLGRTQGGPAHSQCSQLMYSSAHFCNSQ